MEIVHYRKPAGRPKPIGYQVSDQGIMNLAIVSREVQPGMRMLERIKAAGYVPPYVYNDGKVIVCYINDPEHAFEFGVVPEELRDGAYGFVPATFDSWVKASGYVNRLNNLPTADQIFPQPDEEFIHD